MMFRQRGNDRLINATPLTRDDEKEDRAMKEGPAQDHACVAARACKMDQKARNDISSDQRWLV